MTRPNRPIKVYMLCTARQTHPPTRVARGMLHNGKIVWREMAVDIYAGQVWPGEPTYDGGRWTFPLCPRCKDDGVTRPRTLREDTLVRGIEQLAAATHRTKSVPVDLSLLG